MIEVVKMGREQRALQPELIEAIAASINDNALILGSRVEEIETAFAARCGVRHAIGVNSGTDALELVLKALGVGSGDEVVTVANSFVATVAAVCNVGATPVLVDVGEDELVDPDEVARAITDRTTALIAVHLRGQPAAVHELDEICATAGIALIEDCAQAIGAKIATRSVGSFGVAGCFSLHPLKSLGGLGDAGMIVTDRDDLAMRLRLMRNHGLVDRDHVDIFGRNSRLDAIQASALQVKLTHLDQWHTRRTKIARYLIGRLETSELTLPTCPPGIEHSYYHFVVRTPLRDDLRRFLGERGISTLVHYPIPVHHQNAWSRAYPPVRLPRTELQANEILTVPAHEWLTDAEVEQVADTVVAWTRRSARTPGGR